MVNNAHFNRDLRRETVDSIVTSDTALSIKRNVFTTSFRMERRAKLLGIPQPLTEAAKTSGIVWTQ